MASGSRPKGANGPISFAFSNAMSFVTDKPNINNMPAHAWNTATHVQVPLAETISSAPKVAILSPTSGPSTSRPAPSASLLSLSARIEAPTRDASASSSTTSGSSLLQSLAAANPFTPNRLTSSSTQAVLAPVCVTRATPNTTASFPSWSAPPSPSSRPWSAPANAPTILNATSSAMTRPPPSPFQPLILSQTPAAATNSMRLDPSQTSEKPFGTPLNTAGAHPTGSSTLIVSTNPLSNIAWAPVQSSKPKSFRPMTAVSGLNLQHENLHTYLIDPYKVEIEFRNLAMQFPTAYITLVGLYLQESGRTPVQIGHNVAYSLSCRGWERDLRRQDLLNAVPSSATNCWVVPDDPLFLAIVAEVTRYTAPFEASIRWFAQEHDALGFKMEQIIRKAGWTTWMEIAESVPFKIMQDIFKMEEGKGKEMKMAQAKEESPLFFEYCSKDLFCGRASGGKRERVDHDLQSTATCTPGSWRCKEIVTESGSKRIRMSAARPMQVHNVPLEERAFDSKGNRLPWALEWPEGHPNARGQKRYVEEKGPFGKSNKRKGSSRTRTATPAKKENPTLDSFEKALSYDLKRQAESPIDSATPSRPQNDAPLLNKEPTQVLLYGYPSNRQWQAIDTYEKICGGGIICEDYDRQPDISLRRYPNTISSAPRAHMTRPLTKAEKALAFNYAGGAHWVKVTFDSTGAAERAMENSPVQIQQHWVYAQPYYNAITPQLDAPIPMTADERTAGRPLTKHSQIYGPDSTQHTGSFMGDPFTMSQKSTLNTAPSNTDAQQEEDLSISSSTASSGTATGPETSALRHRNSTQTSHPIRAQQPPQPMMRHFPDTPRTVLRPAYEALLPQPTFWERQLRWLADLGLMPGEVIGNGVPLQDNGHIDWARASFYWKFFFWVDSTTGTDYCGLRNDD